VSAEFWSNFWPNFWANLAADVVVGILLVGVITRVVAWRQRIGAEVRMTLMVGENTTEGWLRTQWKIGIVNTRRRKFEGVYWQLYLAAEAYAGPPLFTPHEGDTVSPESADPAVNKGVTRLIGRQVYTFKEYLRDPIYPERERVVGMLSSDMLPNVEATHYYGLSTEYGLSPRPLGRWQRFRNWLSGNLERRLRWGVKVWSFLLKPTKGVLVGKYESRTFTVDEIITSTSLVDDSQSQDTVAAV
jgi:hypothetical protein